MLTKCPSCGAHFPRDSGFDLRVGQEEVAFCSARCAEQAGEGEAAAAAEALPPLPRRILVAVDGSGPSIRAVQMAVVLAQSSDAEVILLHALAPAWPRPPERSSARWLGLDPAGIEHLLREDAEVQLRHARRICTHAGIKFSTRIELARPIEAVARLADDVDLLVLGSRGLGAISGTVLGSLSHRVLAATRTPTLVVH